MIDTALVRDTLAHAIYADEEAQEELLRVGVDTVCGDGTIVLDDGRAFRLTLEPCPNPLITDTQQNTKG